MSRVNLHTQGSDLLSGQLKHSCLIFLPSKIFHTLKSKRQQIHVMVTSLISRLKSTSIMESAPGERFNITQVPFCPLTPNFIVTVLERKCTNSILIDWLSIKNPDEFKQIATYFAQQIQQERSENLYKLFIDYKNLFPNNEALDKPQEYVLPNLGLSELTQWYMSGKISSSLLSDYMQNQAHEFCKQMNNKYATSIRDMKDFATQVLKNVQVKHADELGELQHQWIRDFLTKLSSY